jgi:hypothetical protein
MGKDRRVFSKEEVDAAIDLILNQYPDAFEIQKRFELQDSNLSDDDVRINYGVLHRALHDAGMANSMTDATSLVFSIRKAARRAVGLPV